MIKVYIAAGLAVVIAWGSWSARGWYEADSKNEAIEKQIKGYEAQAEIDADMLFEAMEQEQNTRIIYQEIKHEAENTELCSNGGNDFLKLFNRGAIAANPAK